MFNSRFDAFQLGNILDDFPGEPQNWTSAAGRRGVLSYGDAFVAQLRPAVLRSTSNGVFITTCICHGCPWPNLRLDGLSANEHYVRWLRGATQGNASVHIDHRGPNGGGQAGFGGDHCTRFPDRVW